MDVFGEHVYADTSALPPSMPDTGTTIAEGDYARLVALLRKAFDGTAQRGSTLPIFYREYGVETAVPADKADLYTGSETQKTVDEATQARYYAEAFRLALCPAIHTAALAARGGSVASCPDRTPPAVAISTTSGKIGA